MTDLFNHIKTFFTGLHSSKQGYNMSVVTYNQSARITVQRGCFAVMVTNIGLVNCTVNGMLLGPPIAPAVLGDSRTFGAHKNDLYLGNLTVSFAAGAGALLEVVQLFYTDENQRS